MKRAHETRRLMVDFAQNRFTQKPSDRPCPKAHVGGSSPSLPHKSVYLDAPYSSLPLQDWSEVTSAQHMLFGQSHFPTKSPPKVNLGESPGLRPCVKISQMLNFPAHPISGLWGPNFQGLGGKEVDMLHDTEKRGSLWEKSVFVRVRVHFLEAYLVLLQMLQEAPLCGRARTGDCRECSDHGNLEILLHVKKVHLSLSLSISIHRMGGWDRKGSIL